MRQIIKGSAMIVASVVVVAGGALWVNQSGAAVRGTSGVTTVQPAGINFGIHPHADQNFCLEDVPSGDSASPVSIQECAARDGQDWAWVQTPSGAPGIIDGSGMCFQFGGPKALSVELAPCTLKGSQRFLYSSSGQITTPNGRYCLQDAQATSDATVTMPKCDVGMTTQTWILSH
jgi:hypothetical protein